MKSVKQPCFFGGIYSACADGIIERIEQRYKITLVYRQDLPGEKYGSLHSATDIRIGLHRYAEIRAFIEGYKAGYAAS